MRSTVGETTLAKGFHSNTGNMKYPCVCRRTKLPGRGVHSETVREVGRKQVRAVVADSSQFVVYSGLGRSPMKGSMKRLHMNMCVCFENQLYRLMLD